MGFIVLYNYVTLSCAVRSMYPAHVTTAFCMFAIFALGMSMEHAGWLLLSGICASMMCRFEPWSWIQAYVLMVYATIVYFLFPPYVTPLIALDAGISYYWHGHNACIVHDITYKALFSVILMLVYREGDNLIPLYFVTVLVCAVLVIVRRATEKHVQEDDATEGEHDGRETQIK